MLSRLYLLHAVSPLHAGTGQAADVIDLPIARLRSNGIPFVPGSSIKGVLREAAGGNSSKRNGKKADSTALAIYGPEPETADSDKQHAGALIVSDARLLALPVRSFCGVFAWVSSPLLLSLLERDIQMARESGVFHQEIPVPGQEQQVVADLDQSIIIHTIKEPIGQEDKAKAKDKVFLEDLDLDVCSSPEQIKQLRAWSDYLDKWVMPPSQRGAFSKRFVVVSDEVMAFLWETATQVDTRIRLDTDTRTVARGALWTEESLPPETLLCGVLAAENSRMPSHALRASEVLDEALTEERVLQFGGKSTIGRGRCRMIPGLSALF